MLFARAHEGSIANAANDKEADAAGIAFFEKRIRPVLVEHCYACHSADKQKKQGGLLLDTRAGIRRGGDTSAAVVPGSPDQSLIMEALRYESLEMPPKGKLSAKIVKDFEGWIRAGAQDPRDGGEEATSSGGISIEEGRKFWSFQPIADPAVPTNKDSAWAHNEVDAFILQKQEAAGLAPTTDANPEAIVRRLYFDLIGLPPSPQQLREFLAASATDRDKAVEAVVDELLESPQFGERWGRHWLDVARFSESSGGGRTRVFDHAWRYRDYVIRSFNDDKPFDRFIAEQIAGDLLLAASVTEGQANMAATSFLAIGPINYEAQDKQELDMDVIDEQLDTIGKAVLGMTIGCARCHDHKFDPIPTADYYALAGIFLSTKSLNHANVSDPIMRPLPLDDAQKLELARVNELAAPLEADIAAIQKRIKRLPGSVATTTADNKALQGVLLETLAGVVIDDEQATLVGQWAVSSGVASFVEAGYRYQSAPTGEAKYVAKLTPGKYEVRLSYTPHANRATNMPVRVLHVGGQHEALINCRQKPTLNGLFVSLGEFQFEDSATVIIGGKAVNGAMIADAVQWLAVDVNAANATRSSLKAAMADEANKPTPIEQPAQVAQAEQRDELTKRLTKAQSELAALKKQHAGSAAPMVMSVEEAAVIQDCAIRVRGNVHNQGKVIPRGFLSVMPNGVPTSGINKKSSGRLELAQWMASQENSLTARVFANRVWYWLMGSGIVRSLDNFGSMGETPSHPELLDHLASRFIDDGWSVKQLVRRIVLSRTYQLGSSIPPQTKNVDPDNRLRTYAPRRRLDAESIRDAILAASGQLDLDFGGSTIRPGLTTEYNYEFNDNKLDGRRRSVYVPVFRNSLLDLFEVFDFADPNLVMGRRSVSTLPTQALYLMNSPWVMQQSKFAAERILQNPSLTTEAERIDEAYVLLFGRSPKPGEQQVAVDCLQGSTDLKKWTPLIHTLIASVDFRYLQ